MNDLYKKIAMDDLKEGATMIQQASEELISYCNELSEQVEYLKKEIMKKDILARFEVAAATKASIEQGFPLSQGQRESIAAWQQEHDIKVHHNLKHYHGASGGNYRYVFTPTGIGTIGECVCSICQNNAIREKDSDWYPYCKAMDGIFVFQDI